VDKKSLDSETVFIENTNKSCNLNVTLKHIMCQSVNGVKLLVLLKREIVLMWKKSPFKSGSYSRNLLFTLR
jgi:hypothetical protein